MLTYSTTDSDITRQPKPKLELFSILTIIQTFLKYLIISIYMLMPILHTHSYLPLTEELKASI